ncbi:MAG: hypothetical protein JNL81_03680 [Hyphomonadaceae bacterium]|nr:hypothetical protein [Hyphomonadaceae bacterium]
MVTFALIAEAGPLESQAVLLVRSIRRFAGAYAAAPVIVVSPRADRRPSKAALRAFADENAIYLEMNISSAVPEYGTSYRVHAASRVEAMTPDVLVFLDSDILFARQPDLTLEDGMSAAARPVDARGMCTTGPGDPNDGYWRALCALCDVDYDAIPFLTTTVDGARIKASYNGGFFVVRTSEGILQRTEDFFRRSVEAQLMPWRAGKQAHSGHGLVTGRGARFWGSSQACFSLAAWGAGKRVQELPPCHNFPINNPGYVTARGMLEPIKALHYHSLFGPGGQRDLCRRLNLPADCLGWLEAQLPLAESRLGGDTSL